MSIPYDEDDDCKAGKLPVNQLLWWEGSHSVASEKRRHHTFMIHIHSSVCDVEVWWSYGLEYSENKFHGWLA